MEKIYLKEVIESEISDEFHILDKAFERKREDLFKEIEKSNLLGRGGAGFPTFKKWQYVQGKDDIVLICNADEGEPGTFKDKYIIEKNPEYFLESLLLAAYILNAKMIYIYIRGEYIEAIEKLENIIHKDENIIKIFNDYTKQFLEVVLVKGAGAYVCGDETSLINSIEGKRPNSRMKPPFPAISGLHGKPTIVNNVETLVNIPLIIRDGGDFYRSLGSEKSSGTKLVCLSGNVNKPGVYEVEFGQITLRNIIYDIGHGIKDNKEFKFLIPGGISTQMLVKKHLDIKYSYEDLKNAGSSLGSGALIVADETVSALDSSINVSDFFMRETCGICFPCREGNRQIHHLLNRIKNGNNGKNYMNIIKEISETTTLTARCGLGQTAGNFIASCFEYFANEFK